MSDGTALFDALPVAVYLTDAEGRITYYNEAAAELWGHRPELGTDRWCGSWKLFWPDGRPMAHGECPMAIALRENREVRGAEAIAERPDGTRVNFVPYPTPLHDQSGRLTGAINLLMDITERHRAELNAARMAAIVDSSDDAIVSKTLEGRITSWNPGAARIFGYEPGEMIGQSITRIIPPELHDEERHILAQISRGEHIDHYDTIRVAKDGRRLDISLTISPLRDQHGRVVGATKVARDITERKQAEKLQRLLTDELNHRVKNTLATVQAIATQSLARVRNPTEFASSFSGRIQALARAHALFARSTLRGAELGDIVCDQVLLGASADERITVSGPWLELDPQASVHIALVLHELGTNARKYGALSVPQGRLSVTWSMQTNGGRNLLLAWKETSGPRVSAPTSHGFGASLIEQTLRTHGGEARIEYAASGVTCEIRLPLPEARPHLVEAAQDVRPAAPSRQRPPDRARLAGKRVLVVEDEPLLAMDIEAMLADAGCEVVGPAGALEPAKRLIAAEGCEAALLDANLAGTSVEELAMALTQRNIPFAFVTGYGRQGLPPGFREALMLGKPFSRDQLLSMVGVLLYHGQGVVRLKRGAS